MLTIDVNETVSLDSSVINVGTDPWDGASGEHVFTIELETECKKVVKRVFVEEAPANTTFLCGVCSTFTIDPALNIIRLNLRDRVGEKVEGLTDKNDWKVEDLDGNILEISSVSYDTPGYDFQIIVDNMPAGTKVTEIIVTYTGYGADPGDIVIKVDGVNVNTANLLDLQAIIHIGPVRAQQIIDLREVEPFCCLDDLARVTGIALGGARLQDIKDQGVAYVD